MDKPLTLSDFDILGIIELNDVSGIEKYVTPIYNNEDDKPTTYLSRSKEYYNVKSFSELSLQREELKKLLTREKTKRNFVILENMLNCSAKVYFKTFEDYVSNPNNINKYHLEISRLCMLEDTKNLLTIIQNTGLISVDARKILPTGNENCAKRAIEMDNKAILYMFAKHLKIDEPKDKVQIVTPGYGSLYIGPFLNVMYGYDFTNILKSKYIKETTGIAKSDSIKEVSSNDSISQTDKKIVLLDDNIGTGGTMLELKQQLADNGIECYKMGAVQYNWRNYFKVSVGEKVQIDKFSINDFDVITPFNYAGHKLYDHAIDMLHSSGKEYKNYLQSKSYGQEFCNDIIGTIKRGIIAARKCNLKISKKYCLDMKQEDEEIIKNLYGPVQQIDTTKMEWVDGIIDDITTMSNERQQFIEENEIIK